MQHRIGAAAHSPAPDRPPLCCCSRCYLQWPSLVCPLSPVISEMPGMVLERYNACQVAMDVGWDDGGLHAAHAQAADAAMS